MLILFVHIVVFLNSVCSSSIQEHSPYVPENYVLAFNDEFEFIRLDTKGDGSENWASWWVGWDVRYLTGNNDRAWKCDASYRGNGEKILGINLHEITDSATLRLMGKITPGNKVGIVNNFPYIGGMISANQHYAQKYGYFEFRCKFGVSKGQHWAVWLLPDDNSWPPEIDLVEVVGHQPDKIHLTAYWDDNGHQSNFQTFENVNTEIFHVYGFEWTEEKMTWYLDGVKMKSMKNFVNKPMYFLVSPEVGGKWTGEPDVSTNWPMYCELDYVRIYKKK